MSTQDAFALICRQIPELSRGADLVQALSTVQHALGLTATPTTTSTTTATPTPTPASAAAAKATKSFGGFAVWDDTTDDVEDIAGVDLSVVPHSFGEPSGTEFCHSVGDLVWVKLQGFPNWPAEVLSTGDPTVAAAATDTTASQKSKKNPVPVRLFNPPQGLHEVFWTCGKNLAYFDKLFTEGEVARCEAYRLQAGKYKVEGYKADFDRAVRVANTHARAVLTPEALTSFKVTPLGVAYTNFRAHYQAPRQPSANEKVKRETGMAKKKSPIFSPCLQKTEDFYWDFHKTFSLFPTGVIVLRDGLENLVRDLNKFDRIWVVFQFSYSGDTNRTKKAQRVGRGTDEADFFSGWKSMIVPPRDKQQRGLLATRSPHRPNGIGLSCCKLLNVSGRVLTIRDHDLLHGTPILDVKPYLPFCDSHPEANHGWVDELETPGPDHRWNEQVCYSFLLSFFFFSEIATPFRPPFLINRVPASREAFATSIYLIMNVIKMTSFTTTKQEYAVHRKVPVGEKCLTTHG